jgi:murein DD-endopeptidase MepM/ murein hydrolase activator NlpD
MCALALVLAVVTAFYLIHQGKIILQARKVSAYEKENEELLRKNALVLELKEKMDRLDVLNVRIAGMFGAAVEMPRVTGSHGVDTQAGSPAASDGLPAVVEKTIPAPPTAPAAESIADARPSAWPLTAFGYVTRKFSGSGHTGLDIAVPVDTPVKATGEGIAIEARYDPVYGYYALIDHGGGLSSLYAHNARLLVSEGQRVGKDEIIAFSGSTGESTAPHLHYEVRKEGLPVDPEQYIR